MAFDQDQVHDESNSELFNNNMGDFKILQEEKRLLEQRIEKMNKLLEASKLGTWEWNVQSGSIVFDETSFGVAGYCSHELELVSIENWEKFIHPEDLDLVVQKVANLLKGESADYDVEYRMKHKLGRWIWVHDRGKVSDWDQDGNPLRIFGTHQDITDIKNNQTALFHSNQLLASFISNSPIYTYIKEVSPTESRVLMASENFQDMTGIPGSKMVGKTMQELFPPDFADKMTHDDWAVVSHDENIQVDEELNGSYYATYKYPIKQDGRFLLAGYTIDLTERKLNEIAILKDEARLESLLKINQHPANNIQELLDFALDEAIKLTDSKIGYIYFYNETKRLLVLNSWSKEVMKECTVVEPQTVYELEKTGIWGEAVRQRGPIMLNDFESPHPLKKGFPQGHARLNRFLTIPVFSRDQIVAVIGVANKDENYTQSDVRQLSLMMDAVWKIVGRKEYEDMLEKANRLYAVVSQVNQAIVHNHDLKSLFQAICRVAVDYGKFKMAWIGMPNREKTGIYPVAVSGFESGYLSVLKEYSGLELPGNKELGPDILKELQFKVCNDLANESSETRWKTEALKRGYASFIRLSLKKNGECIACLSLYADRPNFFTDEEISLLNEVSFDIVYALDAIENGELRRQTVARLEASETRFRLLAESAPIGIIIADRQQNAVFVSDKFVELFGYHLEDIRDIASWWKRFCDGSDDFSLIQAGWDQIVENESPIETDDRPLELLVRCKDESVKYAECRMASRAEEVYLLFSDVTDRVKSRRMAEERMKELNAFFRLSELTERRDLSLEELFDEFVQDIPKSLQHVQLAYAKLGVNGKIFASENFTESTPWKMFAPILIDGIKQGELEVGYTKPCPLADEGPFLHEERFLIYGLAERLSRITERKLSVEKLAQSETKYRNLVNQMQLGLAVHEIILDKNGTPVDYRFLDVNSGFEHITGLKRDDVLGKTILELLPDTESIWIERYGKVALSGVPDTFENYSRELDRFYNVVVYQPQPMQFAVVVEDISQRKRDETLLLEEKFFNQTLIENLPGIFYLYSYPELKILRWNRNHETMLDLTAEELKKQLSVDWKLPEEKTKLIAAMHRVIQDGSCKIESTFHKKDGTPISFLLSGVKLESGGKSYILGYGIDITARKQAEEKLVQSENLFKAIMVQSPTVIEIYDLEGRQVSVNKAYEDLWGKPAKLINILKSKQVQKNGLYNFVVRAYQGEAVLVPDYLFASDTNSKGRDQNRNLWLSTRIYPLKDGRGQVRNIILTHEDITLKKQAEKAMAEHIEKFKILSQSGTDMLKLNSTDQIYDYLTEKLYEQYPHSVILFSTVNDERGTSFLRSIKGISIRSVKKALQFAGFNFYQKEFTLQPEHIPVFKSGLFKKIEGGISEFSGPEFPSQAAGMIETLLGIRQIYTIGINNEDRLFATIHFFHRSAEPIRDHDYIETFVKQAGIVIKTKYAEESLRQSEEKYRLLTEHTSDVIWVLNVNRNRFTYISPAIEQLRGYTVEEAMNQTVEESVTPESFISLQKALESKLPGFLSDQVDKNYYIDEIRQPCKNGSLIWIEVSTKFRKNKSGEIEVVGVSRNIEERKKMENEIKANQDRLRELIATKDKFFSIISHDLRSPFATLVGFTELMADDQSRFSIDEYKQYSRAMNKTAQSAYDLLENLLEWSRFQRGGISFKPQWIDLNSYFETFDGSIIEMARQKQIGLSFSIGQPKAIQADPGMLTSILRNLIINAIKFTREGGKIIVETRKKKEGGVVFAVKDTGIGMTPDMLEKLFRIDTRVSRPGTRGESSSGLGLILCKEFVEQHGGKIWVESEKDIGSTFHFTLSV